jgi:predicted DNA-binding protein with PD1-like motif
MNARLLEHDARKTWAIIFQYGDEVTAGLEQFAGENRLRAASFQAIGAFEKVVLGYFDWSRKKYRRIPLNEQVEVLSLLGDIATDQGKPKIHAHVVVGTSEGNARGGHLLSGHVRPTLEVLLTETPAHLERQHDAERGLALIRV